MTSVTQKAREAQFSQFSDDDVEGKRLVSAIYDGVDAMDDNQKTLLIRNALSLAHNAVVQAANGDPASAAFSAMTTGGLLAIAGYANETIREAAGQTSTGDVAVEDVIDNFRLLVRTMAESQMTDEQKATAEDARRRIEAGEDPQKVLADVMRREKAGAGAAPTTDNEESHGLYL